MKVLLPTSGGGHLSHLLWLRDWWGDHERAWVCFDTTEARERLVGERVYWASHPTNRHLPNLWRNTRLARRVIADEAPDLVVSTGAGVALPFFAVAGARGIATCFLEVYDRIDRPSLTGRLASRWVDRVVVQWPEQALAYPGSRCLGPMR